MTKRVRVYNGVDTGLIFVNIHVSDHYVLFHEV